MRWSPYRIQVKLGSRRRRRRKKQNCRVGDSCLYATLLGKYLAQVAAWGAVDSVVAMTVAGAVGVVGVVCLVVAGLEEGT